MSIYLSIHLSIYPSIHLSIYRSIHLSIYRSIHLSIYPSIHLSIYRSIDLSIYRSTYLPIYLSTYLSIYLSVCLSVYLSTCLSANLKPYLFYVTSSFFKVDNIKNAAVLRDFLIFQSWQQQKRSNSARRPHFLKLTTKTKQSCETFTCFKVDNIKNEASLRDFLKFWTWQHHKRSNSARLLHFLNWTTSKTVQFCETSSIFELDNIKNKAILRDVLQKCKVECRADSLVPMRFAIFPIHLSKVLRLPRKSDARLYEVLHLSRKIISANLKIWCSKMQPLSGNQRPHPLTAPMKMSLVLRLPRKMPLCRSSSNVPRLPSFLEMRQKPHVLLTLDKVHNPLRLPRKTKSKTSKRGPYMVCFVHFDFEMCFAPQRCALFRHRNFQKCLYASAIEAHTSTEVYHSVTYPNIEEDWSVDKEYRGQCQRVNWHKNHWIDSWTSRYQEENIASNVLWRLQCVQKNIWTCESCVPTSWGCCFTHLETWWLWSCLLHVCVTVVSTSWTVSHPRLEYDRLLTWDDWCNQDESWRSSYSRKCTTR